MCTNNTLLDIHRTCLQNRRLGMIHTVHEEDLKKIAQKCISQVVCEWIAVGFIEVSHATRKACIGYKVTAEYARVVS